MIFFTSHGKNTYLRITIVFLGRNEMVSLQIKTQKLTPDVALVSLQGVLNDQTADQLYREFKDFIADKIYKFVVDLAQLDRIGSAGLGVFISFIDTLETNKGTIVFVKPNSKVNTTFKMFKLSAFYSVTNSQEDALKEIQALTK